MALIDIWNTSPTQLADKQVQQVIAFAGSGKLLDGGDASREFRDLLSLIPSTYLSRYVDDCLKGKFDGSGLALQDVVNEIGRRLGFDVTPGLYRGASGQIGFDGIWKSEAGTSIVIEVKTTDAYRIDLETVAGYRRSLSENGVIDGSTASMLYVVGRQDTGDLEAQIRGSRHAWDTRLISIDALIRLMDLKEDLEEPVVVQKIRDILTPQEFTRVDAIIDIAFATAEDVRHGDPLSEDAEDAASKPPSERAAFHEACISRIESHLARQLVKRSRVTYTSADQSLAVICAVSRQHGSENSPAYWYAYHPHQKDTLLKHQEAYVALGCGSESTVLLIPVADFNSWLEGMNVTERTDRAYWHVKVVEEQGKFVLHRKTGYDPIDLTKYLLPPDVTTQGS